MELKNGNRYLLLHYLTLLVPNNVFKYSYIHNDSVSIWAKDIHFFFFFIYHHINLQYKLFCDLVTSDFIEHKRRFLDTYNLISIPYNHRIFIDLIIDENMIVKSLISLYPNIMWYERESWDLYGVIYKNNYDLRRILNDYGFKGFPLRKDFPLSGFVEVKYDFSKKSISYEPVRIIQEFRVFNTKVPWNFYH